MRRSLAGVVLLVTLLVPVGGPRLVDPAAAAINEPAVGIAATPSGSGYWIVARDGGVFTNGDARFFGSTGAMSLNQPIVGMAPTPTGNGYWLVASDGGIFTFGDARFFGSTGAMSLNQPIVGMAPTPTGNGYWLAASDGGIFTFGDARFLGSTGAMTLNRPIVGVAATPTGNGYWLVASDGGIFTFGDAAFHGSTGGQPVPAAVGMAAAPGGRGYWLAHADGAATSFGQTGVGSAPPPGPQPAGPPTLSVSTVMSGLTIPWDVAFTSDGAMLVTERPGRLHVGLPNGTTRQLANIGSDLFVSGETGLMSIAVDPDFASTRAFWTCYTNAAPRDVRVVRWTVDGGYTSATRTGVTVSGIPSTSTVHNGCRLEFGADGHLYIGTGDSAQGPAPQSTSSLGGKVLRVDEDSGDGVAGNLTGRIYTLGHRNVQGLAPRPGTSQMFSVEHGPNSDDEVNRLRSGGHAGWDPNTNGSYDQSVPMTDTTKFPDAIRPVWASGSPTLATSGASFVTGSQWGTWNGALVVACLKASQLRVFTLDAAGNVNGQTTAVTDHGRLRSVTQGPDGALYVTTSNGGGNDRVLRIAA